MDFFSDELTEGILTKTNRLIEEKMRTELLRIQSYKNNAVKRNFWSPPIELNDDVISYNYPSLKGITYGVYTFFLKEDDGICYIGHGKFRDRILKFKTALIKPNYKLKDFEHHAAMKARKSKIKPNNLYVRILPCSSRIESGEIEKYYINLYEPPWNDPKMAGT